MTKNTHLISKQLQQLRNVLESLEKHIHQAALLSLGLELRSIGRCPPYRLTVVDSSGEHQRQVSALHRQILNMDVEDIGKRGGNWLAFLPGEIFINLGAFTGNNGDPGGAAVALIHEIAHLYVSGGVPPGMNGTTIEQRVNLLRTRDDPPSWWVENPEISLDDWAKNIARSYMPDAKTRATAKSIEGIEAITQFVTHLFVSELVATGWGGQGVDLTEELLAYDRNLRGRTSGYVRIPDYLSVYGIDLQASLTDSTLRRSIGKLTANQLLHGLPNEQGRSAPFNFEEFEEQLLKAFRSVAQ